MEHSSHRSKRALTKKTARVAQMLAITLCLAGMVDFAYSALQSSSCFVNTTGSLGEDPQPRAAVDSDECRAVINSRDLHFRGDALAVLLGVAVFAGATVIRSNAHRRTKRMVIGIEVAVLVIVLAYSILFSLAWH